MFINTKISTFLKNIREGAHILLMNNMLTVYLQKFLAYESPLLCLPHRNKYEDKTALQREHLMALVTTAGLNMSLNAPIKTDSRFVWLSSLLDQMCLLKQ